MSAVWILIISAIGIYAYRLGRVQNELKQRVNQLEEQLSPARQQPVILAEPTPERPPPEYPPMDINEDKAPEKPEPPQPEYAAPKQEKTGKGTLKELEKNLSSRWMIWVGGLAIALGGGFLVKYSIDSGLLSPAVRVSLGLIMGAALTISGEVLRQRRRKLHWLQGAPDYLPGAISAAGLFSAFAAIYASYALYDLLPALGAFIALAILSFVASGLAWYHGRFFAYLGLIGGIIVPFLVTTGPPSAWGLFPYLLVIITSSLWVSRQKSWADVAATTLLLSLVWAILWITTNWTTGDIIPVGLYLLILGGLNAALLSGADPKRTRDTTLGGMISRNGVTLLSDGVLVIIVVLIASIVRIDHYSDMGLSLITLGLLAQAYAVHRSPANDMGGVITLFGALFLFATWHVPNLIEFQAAIPHFDRLKTAWAPTSPPGLTKFITTVLIFTIVTGGAIFFCRKAFMRKNMWASMGNIIPLMMLIITYIRIVDWGTSLTSAFTAAILACFFTLATNRLSSENREKNITALAAYAAGATTAISLGIAMILRDAWLSFALALQLAALAHIWRLTMVRGLRALALLLASIVFIRLVFNGAILDYNGGQPMPVFNWLFYGYGLTAALFAYAAHIFKQTGEEDRLISILKAGAILLAVAFISLEIRVLFSEGNRLLSDPTGLEAALQTINWGAATTALFWYEVKNNDSLLGRLRRFMTLISLLGLLTGGILLNNVFFGAADVGATPIFNLQFLQFFIPGLLYGLKAYIAGRANKPRSQKLYGVIAFFSLWFWGTAEIFNNFHPNGLHYQTSNWEWYAYSLVWLIYAVLLLLSGLKYHQPKIRQAGLAVLAIVVLKVFLVDMNQLEGLSRALSFMGLGGALIGLGYLYQKLNISK